MLRPFVLRGEAASFHLRSLNRFKESLKVTFTKPLSYLELAIFSVVAAFDNF
ncbi:MAG: hypothetical protein ACFB0D_07205 [Phormidesmis sp.]